MASSSSKEEDFDADLYFEPYKLACLTKRPKITYLSLEAIHYLVGLLDDYFLKYQTIPLISLHCRAWLVDWEFVGGDQCG